MITDLGPVPVVQHDDVWIPTRDGTLLAARVWRPADDSIAVPAIVDGHPYRLSDSSAVHDASTYPWFASHGYACVRFDLRGSGNSEGVLHDEYLPQEQLDCCDVIEWIAAQPWCTGAVGHIGISWGGFAGLQTAAHRPPALRAIISICASDDRYADDVHYRGGAVLANDMLPWASMTLMLNGLPPDPAIAGANWRTMWHQRLQHTPPFIEAWLQHRERDDYWAQGSVCEHYGRIEVPTLAVGGWNDGYVDAVFRLLRNLQAPARGLIGPWSHGSPEHGVPGPAIGFLQEALRWWDHWLKDTDRGVLDDPPLRAWMQDPVAPAVFHSERPGRWVAHDPSRTDTASRWFLADDVLSNTPPVPGAEPATRSARTPQSAGVDAGAWCPSGMPGDWPGDQRREDGASLSCTSPVLAVPLEVLGNPQVVLAVSADHDHANVVVRLCDVAPDGSSLLVSRGVLDLSHRSGHDRSVPLVVGEEVTVTVPLKAVAHRFPAGHRIRLAVQTTYWPWVWPTTSDVDVSVRVDGSSWIDLPVFNDVDQRDITFEQPVQSPPPASEQLRPGNLARVIERDVISGQYELEVVRVAPTTRLTGTHTELGFEDRTLFRITDDVPTSAMVRCENRAFRRRSDWNVSVHTVSEMTCNDDEFIVDLSLTAFEGEQQVHVRSWQLRMPR